MKIHLHHQAVWAVTVHWKENLKVLGPNECAAVGAMKIGRENLSTRRTHAPSAIMPTANPKWHDLRSNPGCHVKSRPQFSTGWWKIPRAYTGKNSRWPGVCGTINWSGWANSMASTIRKHHTNSLSLSLWSYAKDCLSHICTRHRVSIRTWTLWSVRLWICYSEHGLKMKIRLILRRLPTMHA
jgi:hypothetical protein